MEQTLDISAENHRIFKVLEQTPQAIRKEHGTKLGGSSHSFFNATKRWFVTRFWVSPSEETLTPSEVSVFSGEDRSAPLSLDLVLGTIHAHAYLVALLNSKTPSPSQEALRVSEHLWGQTHDDALFHLWYLMRGRSSCDFGAGCLSSKQEETAAELNRLLGEWSKVYLGRLEARETLQLNRGNQKVLQSFEGFVERVENGVACVSLRDDKGRVSHAEIDSKDLERDGIGFSDKFICEVRQDSFGTTLTISPSPRKQLGEEDYAKIMRKLDAALPDLVLAVDED